MKTALPVIDGNSRAWHVIDAEDAVLGRLASKAAMVLMGKHKPTYTPFLDAGDHVVVINAAKVRLTGRKEEQKMYRRHSGYPGGLTETKARTVRIQRPVRMVEEAIQGMLPVWWSPWHGWRFRLIRYVGILYLGYAVKPAAAPQGGGGEPRPVATAAQAPQGAA